MAGIVIGQDGPEGLHGVAPQARLLPIQIMELQHGDLIGTTATLLAGIDRALDPNGDGDLSDHADVILAPVAEPFAAFGASAETVAAEGAERELAQCSSRPPGTTARPAGAGARSPRPPPRPAGWRSARATGACGYRRWA